MNVRAPALNSPGCLMGTDNSLLDRVGIAAPCSASWDDMDGDDRARFCSQCQLNVYNFAELTREQVQALIIEKEGRLCGRIYRRADGTILTRNCPVGLWAMRKRLTKWGGAVAAALVVLVGALGALGVGPLRLRDLQPFKTVCDRLAPRQVLLPLLGEVAVFPTSTQQKKAAAVCRGRNGRCGIRRRVK